MANITTALCAKPSQSEDAFMETLHGMLAAARDGIGRHVHSAFWLKSAFGLFGAKCYDAAPIYERFYAGPGAWEKGGAGNSNTTVADTIPVLQAVLKHEKYNLAEGFFFLNMSYSILERGAAFCRDPDLHGTVEAMSVELEARMAFHSSSVAFDELRDNFRAHVCTELDETSAYQQTYDRVAAKVDDYVNADELDCSFSTSQAATMPFLKSPQPDTDDLITIIAGNVRVALAAAAQAVAPKTTSAEPTVLAACLSATSAQPDAEAAARVQAKLIATGLPASLFPQSRTVASTHIRFLTNPNVYHKLAATCAGMSTQLSDVCVDVQGDLLMIDGRVTPSEADRMPIFDLVTSTSLTKCSGDACKAAARAVLNYQRLLGNLTAMRFDTLHVAMGTSWGGVPDAVMNQSLWTFQRSCEAYERIVDQAAYIQNALPAVIADLRATAPQLEAACVAPPRSKILGIPGLS